MGEHAEQSIDDGADELTRHASGNCGDDFCRYCDEDERRRKRRARKRPRTTRTVRVSVNGLKIRQNKKDGRRRRIFRKERAGRITYHNAVEIPARAKLVYAPERPLKCGARAWIEWEEK